MLRKLSMLAILGSAIGVPYAMFKGEQATQLANDWLGTLEKNDGTTIAESAEFTPASNTYFQPDPNIYDPTAYAPLPLATSDGVSRNPAQPPANSPLPITMADALRMNITRQWVTEHWARVTTTLADTHYAGLRVAFVSGMTETDVTGSLTYYFDRNEQLQRITFHGTTGDPRPLTQLLTQQMDFEKQATLGGELYTRSWLGRTTSVYRLRPAGVLHSGASNSRYEILLELNRAQWRSNLSDTAAQLME